MYIQRLPPKARLSYESVGLFMIIISFEWLKCSPAICDVDLGVGYTLVTIAIINRVIN